MAKVIADITMSVDGFVTGPDDRPGRGLGERGECLHNWVMGRPWRYDDGGPRFAPLDADRKVMEEAFGSIGASIIGRRMFDVTGGWGGNLPGSDFHAVTAVAAAVGGRAQAGACHVHSSTTLAMKYPSACPPCPPDGGARESPFLNRSAQTASRPGQPAQRAGCPGRSGRNLSCGSSPRSARA